MIQFIIARRIEGIALGICIACKSLEVDHTGIVQLGMQGGTTGPLWIDDGPVHAECARSITEKLSHARNSARP